VGTARAQAQSVADGVSAHCVAPVRGPILALGVSALECGLASAGHTVAWRDSQRCGPDLSAQAIGVRLLRTLMRRVCQPLATPETLGAFAFGLPMMAIDGTLEDVVDTPENVRFFGRLHGGATRSPYPQARCVHLSEVGTHAISDSIIAPVPRRRTTPQLGRAAQHRRGHARVA
jgi:hypothetical protein